MYPIILHFTRYTWMCGIPAILFTALSSIIPVSTAALTAFSPTRLIESASCIAFFSSSSVLGFPL